ncbi:hypothetical protein GWI33_016985 [Rhynchophorus ferrugineus]|uniref:Uncharacterized protein n=1 Tax=Rhynchophorus ferrugineus TaxID=354439 RepID=A0A834HZU1_RHYFE|nr:hypothetical protein GWI33_016985 [Rhynchophorus ferrugineus]
MITSISKELAVLQVAVYGGGARAIAVACRSPSPISSAPAARLEKPALRPGKLRHLDSRHTLRPADPRDLVAADPPTFTRVPVAAVWTRP